MIQVDLVGICFTAFLAVFLLLAVLAGLMRLTTSLFPFKASHTEKEVRARMPGIPQPGNQQIDSAHIAAIASTYHKYYPGKKVTLIQEIT